MVLRLGQFLVTLLSQMSDTHTHTLSCVDCHHIIFSWVQGAVQPFQYTNHPLENTRFPATNCPFLSIIHPGT